MSNQQHISGLTASNGAIIYAGHINVTHERPAPDAVTPKTFFRVPISRDKDFVGQEKLLNDISRSLEQDGQVALTGAGGIG